MYHNIVFLIEPSPPQAQLQNLYQDHYFIPEDELVEVFLCGRVGHSVIAL